MRLIVNQCNVFDTFRDYRLNVQKYLSILPSLVTVEPPLLVQLQCRDIIKIEGWSRTSTVF